MHPIMFPAPGPEHMDVIACGILRDLEISWGVPAGTLDLTTRQSERLRGLAPREMRRAVIEMLADESVASVFAQH